MRMRQEAEGTAYHKKAADRGRRGAVREQPQPQREIKSYRKNGIEGLGISSGFLRIFNVIREIGGKVY